MCDRNPLATWSTTRTTLLGDAAHPMYPMGSNGASQAILEARVLADSLASTSTIEAGLHRYESLRIPPTTRLVELNRHGGPEAVIDLVERRAPNGFARLSDVATTEELEPSSVIIKPRRPPLRTVTHRADGSALRPPDARPAWPKPTERWRCRHLLDAAKHRNLTGADPLGAASLPHTPLIRRRSMHRWLIRICLPGLLPRSTPWAL